MLDKIKALWGRIEVSWHAFAAAMLTALPVLLDQLGVIDLKPILEHILPAEWAGLAVGLLPWVLAFLKPMVAVTPTVAPVATEETPK
jgi:hypothetical protein